MKEKSIFKLLTILSAVLLSGCVVRSYELTRERVDQDLAGNRGYLAGQGSAEEPKEKKTTRTSQVVELEFRPLIKFESRPKQEITSGPVKLESRESEAGLGNRGYLTESYAPSIVEPSATGQETIEKYTVKQGDTLEKISKNFYGTMRKWHKIYEANKVILKGPNKIYPGQVLDIPVIQEEGLKEPQENLK